MNTITMADNIRLYQSIKLSSTSKRTNNELLRLSETRQDTAVRRLMIEDNKLYLQVLLQ